VTPILFKTGKASSKNQLIYKIKHLFFRIILWCQVNWAAKIIVPTRSVKKQLENIYGNKIANKTDYIYEGINYQIIGIKENSQFSKKLVNFFIYVGNFYPHKNVEKLIEAFSKIKTSSKLLLIGPNDFFRSRMFLVFIKLHAKQDARDCIADNRSRGFIT